MSDREWFVLQDGRKVGPFGANQIKQMIDANMIAGDSYLMKQGWENQRPLRDSYGELDLATGSGQRDRRTAAPRTPLSGRVIAHNDDRLMIGEVVNISASGMFVRTDDQVFKVGELLKLAVRPAGDQRPFNATVQVVRYNAEPGQPKGIGLRFA